MTISVPKLREVIVNGVLETEWQQILAVCLFLATAALLRWCGCGCLPPLKVWIRKRRFPLASASKSRPVPQRSDGCAAQYAQAILRCRFG